MVSSSTELHGESHTTENVKCAIGVHGEDIKAGDSVPISTPSESTQILNIMHSPCRVVFISLIQMFLLLRMGM